MTSERYFVYDSTRGNLFNLVDVDTEVGAGNGAADEGEIG